MFFLFKSCGTNQTKEIAFPLLTKKIWIHDANRIKIANPHMTENKATRSVQTPC